MIVVLCALLLRSGPAAASDCVDYSQYIRWLGTITMPGAVYGGVPGPGWVTDVAVSGNCAYVLSGSNSDSLQVVDVSDPENLRILGSVQVEPWNAYTSARAVAASGTHVCVADDLNGIVMVNATVPEHPEVEAILDTPGHAVDVAVLGSYVGVADITSCLIVDISTPSAPQILGSVATSDNVSGVALSGSHAFIANYLHGLQVIDIADPTHPTIVGSAATRSYAVSVAVSGSFAYVADSDSGLAVIDVSNPQNPRLVAEVSIPNRANKVALSDNHVLVATGTSIQSGADLQVVDVSDPLQPRLVTSFCAGSVVDLTVVGSRAYIAGSNNGLSILDVSHLQIPKLVGLPMPSWTEGVALSGPSSSTPYAYVACSAAGLQVVDLTHPDTPAIVGSVVTPGSVLGVAVSGDYAYLGEYSAFRVIDIRNPHSPQVVASVSVTDHPWAIALVGNYAYVTASDYVPPHGGVPFGPHLFAFDIADPLNPRLMSELEFHRDWAWEAHSLAVAGTHVYVAATELGLEVVDISDPPHPRTVNRVPIRDPHGVAISGHIAYVTDWGDPYGPTFLHVLDITNPETPEIVSSIPMCGRVTDVAVCGDDLYVTQTRAVQVFDISDPKKPRRIGNAELPDAPVGLVASKMGVYFADVSGGLQILGSRCASNPTGVTDRVPAARRSLSVFPNPTLASVTIRFDTPVRGPARSCVYDVTGRLVRTLVDGAIEAGTHDLAWDGRDERGYRAPAGVYFVRVATGRGTSSSRISLVR